ncbi:lipopolysaccharide biosynthesis protein [Sphingosinicella rhizophila]|uniref:Lipopolysaccharide biosynthesis protein n=1 Tax=Sphingosinicella rhizophila TaxID=3050082 RepID=A0ABU3Q658_9SPHN|nr:lipopolysaccharide biosynthesis protein [Sphingosinicella sp. GR2756]MDT9598893.1 lipopolysaccharide biosynthesis protein [Sphingosinicella sp. GR2756]
MSVEKGVAAGKWSAADISIRLVLNFAVSVILARILAPADFGIVAIVTFFTSLSAVFIEGGMTAAVVQRQDTSREEESAVFWWNLFASILLAAALVALGPAIAVFYGHPVIGPLMYVAGAQLVFSALGAVPSALLTRELKFDRLTKVGITSSLCGGAVGLAAAFSGAGIWALALQTAAAALVNSAMLWMMSDWRPALHVRFRHMKRLVGFGSWVGFASLLEVSYTQGYALLIGKLHGVVDLGYYNRAHGTQLVPSALVGRLINRVAFPLFAQKAEDPAAFRRGARLAIQFVMLLNVPAMTGIALLSDLVILVLFGEKWLAAAPILTILAFAGMLLPMQGVNVQMSLARGDTSSYIRNELWKKAIGIAAIVAGSFFGIIGLAWSQLVYSILALVVNARPAGRNMNYGVLHQLADIRGVAFAAIFMAIIVLGLRQLLTLSPVLLLGTCAIAGAATYVAAGFAIRSAVFLKAWELFGTRRRKTP